MGDMSADVRHDLQERQHLEVIYGRYLRDEAQSEQAKAIRAGKTF